jgi:hypothetical protein
VLPQHHWLQSARLIENTWEAVEAVCENVEDILEPEDFEGETMWFSACVPIQWEKPSPGKRETPEEWNERLGSLRSMPPQDIAPIILFMDAAGELKIVDGYHRIALSIERGCGSISALIRYCQVESKKCR